MMFPFVDNEEDDEKVENLYIPREYGNQMPVTIWNQF